MPAPRVHVVAGVLLDARGRVLVARRPQRTHLAGLWEFPGGKLMPGESREAGLARELAEELGVRVLSAHPLIRVEHRYPDRDVVLDVWRVESFTGEPYGREGQRVEWHDVHGLDPARFHPPTCRCSPPCGCRRATWSPPSRWAIGAGSSIGSRRGPRRASI